ncbi:MAG: hypothetical protein AAGK78_08170 [Planctomycetota bacterium]
MLPIIAAIFFPTVVLAVVVGYYYTRSVERKRAEQGLACPHCGGDLAGYEDAFSCPHCYGDLDEDDDAWDDSTEDDEPWRDDGAVV